MITPTATEQAGQLVVHNPTYTAASPAAAESAAAATASQPDIDSITVGKTPLPVAVNPVLSRAYVGNQTDKTVSVIDTTTGAVMSTVNVGAVPSAVAVSPDGSRAYVALKGFTGKVAVIDTATNTVVATVKVEANRPGSRSTLTGRAPMSTNSSGNSVSVIDTGNSKVLATVRSEPSRRGGGQR